jgi:hypothetical protein
MVETPACSVVATPLRSTEIAVAFPLARLMMPALDLPAWERLARPLVDDERVLKVRNEAGYICALCTFHVEEDEIGRKLVVDRAIVLEMVDRRETAGALSAGLDAAAHRLSCVAVHTRLAAEQEGLFEGLREAGHEPRMTLLCKPLGRCPALSAPRAVCQPTRCFEPRSG